MGRSERYRYTFTHKHSHVHTHIHTLLPNSQTHLQNHSFYCKGSFQLFFAKCWTSLVMFPAPDTEQQHKSLLVWGPTLMTVFMCSS